MQKVGKRGVITVEENKGLETENRLILRHAVRPRYLSPYFVTNSPQMPVELDRPRHPRVANAEKNISVLLALLVPN